MFLICIFLDVLIAIATPFALLAGLTQEQINEGIHNIRLELDC